MSGFDEALEQAINALHQGASVDDCLARHPEHAEQLRPLLALAAALYAAPTASMSPQAFDAQRERLRAGVRAQTTAAPALVRRGPWMRALASHRLALLAAALLVAIILGLRGVTFVGAKAAPNEALYPVKRAMEAVVLILPASDQIRAARALDSADSRLTESSAVCATDPIRAAALRAEMRGQHDAALSWLAGLTDPDATALRNRAALLAQREADIAVSCARPVEQIVPAAAPAATPTLATTATVTVTATPSITPTTTSVPTRVITRTPTASLTATDTPPATLPPATATVAEAPARRSDGAPTESSPASVPTRDSSPRPTNPPAATAAAPPTTTQPPPATATQPPPPTATAQPPLPTPTAQVVEVTRPATRPTATPAPRPDSATITPRRP